MSDAAAPRPARPKRLDPFESVFQVAQLAARRSFGGARAWICLVLVLLPCVVAFIVRGRGTDALNQERFFYQMLGYYHFGTAVPLTALLFATSFPWPEAEEGTLTYWFTSPVRRWTVLLGRYVAAFVVGAPLLCLSVIGTALPLHVRPDTQFVAVTGAAVATTLVALPAYLALFQLMATWIRFGLVLGVKFILIENLVSVVPGVFPRVTLVYYVRSEYWPSVPQDAQRIAEIFHVAEPATSLFSFAAFAAVTVVSLGLSLLLVESIEYRGRSSQP